MTTRIQKCFFSRFRVGSETQKTSDNPSAILYRNRLKRGADEAETQESNQSKDYAGRIFLAGIALVFLMMPFKQASAAAFLTLSSFSGHAATVGVSGGGFTPGETVSVYVNSTSGQPAGTGTVKANSLFGPVSVNIPVDAPQGGLPIFVVGSTSKLTATNNYYVVPFAPVIDIGSNGNTPGTAISVSGKGYSPGETVDITFGPTSVGSAKADAKGNFPKTNITIPSVASDTYLIHAKGATSGGDAVGYFFVGNFYPAASPSVYYIMPGQALTFSGYGFASGESVDVFLGQGTAPVSSFKTTAKGDFAKAGAYTVPVDAPTGAQTFHLKSSVTKADISFSVTIGKLNSLVTPDNYFISPGQVVYFYGKGFAPNENIDILQGDQDQTLVKTIKADKNGGFVKAGGVTIPFSARGGKVTFTFVGQQSKTSSTLDVSVGAFNPQIMPSEYYLTPGKSFTVWGKGFAPGETVVMDVGGTAARVATDKFGVFKTSGPFAAPLSAGSLVNVKATGEKSGASSNLTLTVGSLHPLVIPENYYVLPGDEITFSGYGFVPGEKVLLQSASTTIATIATDKLGNFTKQSVSAPFEGGRDLGFSFVGEKSGASADAAVTVAHLFPVITADNYYVPPGSVVKVMAVGFSRGEPVTVAGGTSKLTINATKDGYTPWVPVTLPMDLLAKNMTITFTGDATGASNTVKIKMAPFNPQILPSTYYTAPGTKINFSGTGFAALETITVGMGSTTVTTTKTNLDGAFAVEGLTIPMSATKGVRFTFDGDKSKASAGLDVSIAPFNPQIYPSTYYAAPGQTVTFSGVNFAPGEKLDILMDGAVVDSMNVDGKGKFSSKKIPIPIDGAKAASFTFNSSISHVDQPISVALSAFQPQIYPSQYFSAPGTPLTFKGFGFAPGEKVTIMLNESQISSATADKKGNFLSDKINLPLGTTKSHFTFDSSISHYSKPIDVSVQELSPVVTLNTYYAAGGKPLVVSGSGFAASEPVTVTFGDQALGITATNPYGYFTLKTTVPFGTFGEKEVKATGSNSNVSGTATFQLPQAFVNVQLQSYAGAPGSIVTFIGSGFMPGETVNVTTDRTGSAVVHSFKADAKGNFKDGGFKVPVEFRGGQLSLTVQGEHSLTPATITYFVTGP